MLKESKYNIYFNDCIYNTRSFQFIKIGNNDKKILQEKKYFLFENKFLEILEKKRFLVDRTVNEVEGVIQDYLEKTNDKILYLQIMATNSCNFSCKYCYESKCKESIDSNFFDIFSRFIENNIDDYKCIQIEWFGGEPLLMYDEIINISLMTKRVCESRNKSFVSSITTNGYFLTKDIMKKMIEANILYYQITIDGSKQTHDYYRTLKDGSGTFDRIMHNILEINGLGDVDYPFQLVVRCNVNKRNISEAQELANNFSNIFSNKRILFLPYRTCDWGGESVQYIKNDLYTEEEYNKLKFNVSRIYNANYKNDMCYSNRKYGYVLDNKMNLYDCSHVELTDANRIGYISKNGEIIIERPKKNRLESISQECKKCVFLPICIYSTCPKKFLHCSNVCYQSNINEIRNNLKKRLLYEKNL